MKRVRLLLHAFTAHPVLLLFLIGSLPPAVLCQSNVLDDLETLDGWRPVTSHGSASRLAIAGGEGKSGKAMVMEYSFLGHMGSIAVEKRLQYNLPANYQISFDIRGEGLPNNFIIRMMDSLENVWVVMKTNYQLPSAWTRVTIRKHQVKYGWGPSGGGELRTLDRIMIMLDVVEGGAGKVWVDNLAIEPLEESGSTPPRIEVSSMKPGHEPHIIANGRAVTGWESSGLMDREWLLFAFPAREQIGGLIIDWDPHHPAMAFDVLVSDDRIRWSTAYSVKRGGGRRNYICLYDVEARYLKLDLKRGPVGKVYGIRRLELKGPEFSFSPNDFFSAVAAQEPKGFYPLYLLQRQSYWTVVGAAADTREALMNEQGMIETRKRGFSLEPFLSLGNRLITWNDVSLTQVLEKGYLPIPSVQWSTQDAVRLTVTPVAAGRAGQSVLFVRYRIENGGAGGATGKLFVTARPFQVNPPWQTFTIVGGTARIGTIRCSSDLWVDGTHVIPLTRPVACGAAEFDQGQLTDYLQEGKVPPSAVVHDHVGYASAALQYDFSLVPGERRDVFLAVPFYDSSLSLRGSLADQDAQALYDRAYKETVAFWESKLNAVTLSLPPDAPPIANAIKANLAFVLINADGLALQPGSRSYERSWIRDGALTSAAFLQMGIADEVRKYIDWYAQFQYPDGSIPCVVETRGPEPTPEHDSHGQFIYAVAQYFRFVRDTAWLHGKWEHVGKTARYIQSLRAQRKTETYRSGTPQQRACYGLVPESISHEGYCPAPMHSYWDDFFALRGLKDAAFLARVLGKKSEAREFAAETEDFRRDLTASIRLATKNTNVRYIPGCVELGDFSGLSTTVAITPCEELNVLPQPELHSTFDESYRMFRERKENAVRWDAYLPYEARFIGTYVLLEQKDRAYEVLEYLMGDRRPSGWMGWGEVVWKDPSAPRSIGDMPHSWAASDFIRSVRTMLVHEREKDDALIVAAGIPASWLDGPAGFAAQNLPTYYGHLSYSMKRDGERVIIELSGDADPPGGILVHAPDHGIPVSVSGDGTLANGDGQITVHRLPAKIALSY